MLTNDQILGLNPLMGRRGSHRR